MIGLRINRSIYHSRDIPLIARHTRGGVNDAGLRSGGGGRGAGKIDAAALDSVERKFNRRRPMKKIKVDYARARARHCASAYIYLFHLFSRHHCTNRSVGIRHVEKEKTERGGRGIRKVAE